MYYLDLIHTTRREEATGRRGGGGKEGARLGGCRARKIHQPLRSMIVPFAANGILMI